MNSPETPPLPGGGGRSPEEVLLRQDAVRRLGSPGASSLAIREFLHVSALTIGQNERIGSNSRWIGYWGRFSKLPDEVVEFFRVIGSALLLLAEKPGSGETRRSTSAVGV